MYNPLKKCTSTQNRSNQLTRPKNHTHSKLMKQPKNISKEPRGSKRVYKSGLSLFDLEEVEKQETSLSQNQENN